MYKMCFWKSKSKKYEIKSPNIMHPEMVKIIRWQFEQYEKRLKDSKKLSK